MILAARLGLRLEKVGRIGKRKYRKVEDSTFDLRHTVYP